MAILRIVRGAHRHFVHVGFMKSKLHCPLPIRDAFVLIPPDSPIPSNALQSVLSLLKVFFRRGVISQPLAHRLRNAFGIVHSFCLATLPFALLSGWLRDSNQVSG